MNWPEAATWIAFAFCLFGAEMIRAWRNRR